MPVVLVLTNPSDGTADRVSAALRDRDATVVRFDTAEFPLECGIVSEYRDGKRCQALILRDWASSIDLGEVGSVWYRRPRQFRVNSLLRAHEQQFALSEASMAVGGILRNLDCFWMNHPACLAEARYKLSQLQEATRCGLRIPRSLVTNDPGHVRLFLKDVPEGTVIKALGNPSILATEDDPVRPGIVVTSAIDLESIEDLSRVRHTACFIQERIPKAYDLRVTMVGSHIFPVAIASQENSRSMVDWRVAGPSLRHEITSLPKEVEAGLRRVMSTFRLHYAAVDMVLTPDGDYVFLELNPNGEWQWLEKLTGLPISSAIADVLISSAHRAVQPERDTGRDATGERGIS